MTAYDASDWTDLFVATAGASAALAGLVFVAVSINVERILKFEGLPERALQTVLLLLSVVIVSIICLIPQGRIALGLELLAVGLAFAVQVTRLSQGERPPGVKRGQWLLNRVFIQALGTVPFVIGGISLIAESGGGLYWTAAGIVFAISGAVANAWVLLVEILR